MGKSLNIGLGNSLQIQMDGKGQVLKITGTLVGMIPDEFLIIRIPYYPGILSRLEAANSLVVRYVYAGNVYGFSSSTLSFINKPALMVFLSYPIMVEKINLRKTQRIECRFLATMETDSITHKATVVDISHGGCRLYLDNEVTEFTSFNVDQTISLFFYLPGIPEEQVIKGIVRNLKKDGKLCEMGIRFDTGPEVVLKNIKRFVDSFAVSTD